MQVSCNQRGRNASQLNLGGTGLGSFNDRFRDSIVGGSPFGPVQFQGFASGLATQPSAFMQARMRLLPVLAHQKISTVSARCWP